MDNPKAPHAGERLVSARMRLEERVRRLPSDEKGNPDFSNLHRIGIEKDVTDDIRDCLASGEPREINDGFQYLSGLLEKYRLEQFGNFFVGFLVDRVRELLKHSHGGVRYHAIRTRGLQSLSNIACTRCVGQRQEANWQDGLRPRRASECGPRVEKDHDGV